MSYATIVWKNKKTGKLVRNVIADERHLFSFLGKFRVPMHVRDRVLNNLPSRGFIRMGGWSCVIIKNEGLFSKNYKGKLCAD